MQKIIKGASINPDFFVTGFCSCKTGIQCILHISARKSRTDDCMDAGGRATQEAKAENRSVYDTHEDLSTGLTPQSRKKTVNRGALKMANRMAIALALMLAGLGGANASPGMDSLNYFFNEINSFEARFGQKVLDESMAEIDDGQGKVWIQRPGLFRWNYAPPDAQEIVGDGENVWIYDIELEQIAVRNQSQTLGESPAILLAGTGNLEENYNIEDIGTQGRYDWVNLIPKSEDSGFKAVRIGFEDNRLRLMELRDNLGQTTRIVFVDLQENVYIPPTTFQFIAPQGVDIIDHRES